MNYLIFVNLILGGLFLFFFRNMFYLKFYTVPVEINNEKYYTICCSHLKKFLKCFGIKIHKKILKELDYAFPLDMVLLVSKKTEVQLNFIFSKYDFNILTFKLSPKYSNIKYYNIFLFKNENACNEFIPELLRIISNT